MGAVRSDEFTHQTSLGLAFQSLGLWIAFGHDAAACSVSDVMRRPVVPFIRNQIQRSNRDIECHVAAIALKAQCSAVRTSGHVFEFIDDLHRPYLRCARDRARWKGRPKYLVESDPFSKSSRDLCDTVDHAWVALDHSA